MRLVVLGIGGHIGTAVAQRLDVDPRVRVVGIDVDPPRRLLRHAEFHRVGTHEHDRTVGLICSHDPTAILHAGVFEPHARANPGAAHRLTLAATRALVEAAPRCPSLERVIVRSGIEIYGRRRGAPLRPDEDVPADPTSGFGRTLARVEEDVAAVGRALGVPVTRLRFAPLAGPHIPSPVTRYLRLPGLVPVGLPPDPPFSLLHGDDATAAIVAALHRDVDAAVNVVGEGAVTGAQAVRLGGRIPIPVAGPGWLVAGAIAAVLGSPLPDHVLELLLRGRTADGARAAHLLGVTPARSTVEIVREMHRWPAVVELDVHRAAA
jgi:UDP-glucose 4-epimerase